MQATRMRVTGAKPAVLRTRPSAASMPASIATSRRALAPSPFISLVVRPVTSTKAESSSAPAATSVSAAGDAPHHSRTEFEFGHVFRVRSEEEIDAFVSSHKDITVVLESKSKTCKPCQAFLHDYTLMADRFQDTAFLTTPNFRIYREGECAKIIVGVKKTQLTEEILSGLKPEERGRDWTEPEFTIDSDSDED
eukprot:gene15227-21309_t